MATFFGSKRPLLVVATSFAVACGSAASDDAPQATPPTPPASADRRSEGGESGAEDAGISGDDGGVLEGGAAADAGGPDGASDAGDAGGGPLACGASFCRGGQLCQGGACVAPPCVGTKVPGDYASVQGAVTAIRLQGGGTICVGAGKFNETVSVDGRVGPTIVPIRIHGVSADMTQLYGISFTGVGEITGVSVVNGAQVKPLGDVKIDNTRLWGGSTATVALTLDTRSAPGAGIASVRVSNSTMGDDHVGGGVAVAHEGTLDVTLEGNVIRGGASMAALSVYIEANPGPLTMNVRNNVILGKPAHGTQGFMLNNVEQSVDVPGKIVVVNNTFRDLGTAFTVVSSMDLVHANNIFADNDTAIEVYPNVALSKITHANELLSKNGNNYKFIAADGPGYVKADALLSAAIPPVPGAGSPALGMAAATHAPATDFWGAPRGSAAIDVGAVEVP